MPYYVYILARKKRGTFYTGVTNDLIRRVWEHKEGVADGFTKKHGIKTLVYFETYDDVSMAIHREKIIKKWKRSFKYDAIEKTNPEWRDLYEEITEQTPDHPQACHSAFIVGSELKQEQTPQQVRGDNSQQAPGDVQPHARGDKLEGVA